MRFRHGMELAAFCLLAGSDWLVDAVWPTTVPPLLMQSVPFAIVGGFALIICWSRPLRVQEDTSRLVRVAAASLLLFAVPSVTGQLASAVRPETSVALYALAPLCIVGLVAFANDSVRALMVPALAGAAGLWLILPWQMPSTGGGSIAFATVLLSVFLSAASSVWIYGLLQESQFWHMLVAVAFTNAAVFALIALAHGERVPALSSLGPELLRGLLIEVPQICILLWLFRSMAPERLASRFLLVPLVTLLEGVVVLHAQPDLRTGLGLFLLLSGAGGLLLVKRETTLCLDLR